MWRLTPLALAVAVSMGTLATRAEAQFDSQHNHLKCYQIKGTTITGKLLLENQFGREVLVRLQPTLLCAPTKKTCCVNDGTVTGCQQIPCASDPVVVPVPHFKCYKITVKQCTDDTVACATVGKLPKDILVNLRDQFGTETNVLVGKPRLLCAPVEKTVVGQTTTTITTTTTTTSTTSTTIDACRDTAPSGTMPMCAGSCPNATDKCLFTTANGCHCVPQTQMCMGAAACTGLCPNAIQQCVPGTPPAGCVCLP